MINEDAPTMSAGNGGFTGSAAATGPNAGFDPLLGGKKVKKRKYGTKKNVKEEVVDEAKVDKGRSDYGKATIRNWRHSGPSTVEPAMFDPENKRGKTIDKRREEHKARRGVKKAKVPAYKVDEAVKGQDREMRKMAAQDRASGKEKRLTVKQGRRSVKPVRYRYNEGEDKAFNYVVAKLKKQHGDGVLTKGDKIKPLTAAQKKANAAHQAKVDKENAAERAKDPSQGRYPKG